MLLSFRHHLSVALFFAKLSIQRSLEYPFSFFGTVSSLSFSYIWIGMTLKLLVENFQPLSGWTFPQLSFLYGLSLISRGIMSILSFQSRQIDDMVTRGEFDLLLLRPLSVTFQFAANKINLVGLLHVYIGIAFFSYGAELVGFVWDAFNTVKVLLVVLGVTLIYWSFFTLISSVAFWTMRSGPLVNASQEILRRGTFYPLTIYPHFLQLLLTLVVPIGFISFYPSCDFLNQDAGASIPSNLSLLTPVVGVGMFLAALYVFNLGLKSYESAGS